MRIVIIILISVFTFNKMNAQSTSRPAKFDANILIPEAKEVMKALGLKVRDSIKYDGALVTKVIDRLGRFNMNFGLFLPDSGLYAMIGNDTSTLIWAYPTITIAPNVDSILYEHQDTSLFQEMYAKSIVLHEVVHYLSVLIRITNPDSPKISKSNMSRLEYMSLPEEKEATAAQAYFFIKSVEPQTLRMLETYPLLKNKDEYFELLIDTLEMMVWGKVVFGRYELVPRQ